ncbi:MAG: Spy/CpxP family protein refolding chaperone [Sulfurisoma sp.]|nr:Spy/CpxP family protein refolding chaperone [Sulfurisoma sp.]
MESSTKIFASIVAAGILGATAVAWAQPGMGGAGGCNMGPMGMSGMGGMGGMGGPGMMKSGMKFDPAARAEQRLSMLKSELKPTAQQEPLWNAFADKAKAEAGKGMQAMRDKARDEKLTAPEHMTQMNAAMKERLAAHEAVTDAFKRLYDSLTPGQKKAADTHMTRMGSMSGPGGRRGGPPAAKPGQPGPQGMCDEAEHRHG